MLPGVCYFFSLMSTCLNHSHSGPFYRVAAWLPPLCPWHSGVTLFPTSHWKETASFCSPTSHSHHCLSPVLCLSCLAIQPRMFNVLEVLADHTLAIDSRQADACCFGWGSFPSGSPSHREKKYQHNLRKNMCLQAPSPSCLWYVSAAKAGHGPGPPQTDP